jgi:bacillolysin
MASCSPSIHRLVTRVGAVAALLAGFGIASDRLQAQNPSPGAAQDPRISFQQRAECLAFDDTRTSRHLRTGAVRFIGTEPGRPIPNPVPVEAGRSPEAAARAYLSVCGSLFGLQDPAGDLTVTRTVPADARRTVVRFQQRQSGIPIMGAELIVHLDDARNILVVSGKTLPQTGLNTTPVVAAATAVETALDTVAKEYAVDRGALAASAPQLWFYSPALIGPEDGPTTLVWRMEVTPQTLLPIRELVLVDAQRGSVRLHFNQVETIKNRATYTANNTTTLPGTLVCSEADPTCSAGDTDAALAHLYAGDTYDFYLTNHGRDSLNNAGLTLVSTVHYGAANYQNAFWNGSQMAYGNGFSAADDVVGHELTHGVTQYTSGLFYYYQSGAINESLSDVFGEFIDQTNGHGNDSAGARWVIGEDVPGIGAIRNMQDPSAFSEPDKMTSPFYYLGSSDNGGVHFNSGINNKAAYLMVDGGTFNGQTVTGLGIPKVAKIYYEVQTHLLTSGSDYGDLGDALYQGCSNLVGTAGITTSDCQQVRNATLAVEMNLQPASGFNPEDPLCTIGQTPVNLFFDDMENGTNNFAFSAAVGSNRWGDSIGFAHSGQHSLFGYDYPDVVTDTSVTLTNGIVLPSGAFLHFAHAFGFEAPNFDGGVVEYTTNGGSTWNDAGLQFNGYTGELSSASDNPLGGRVAFVGTSHGYVSSRLDLSALAGQTVRFRWRMALDSGGFDRGWWLDDVRVYTCTGPRLTQVSPNNGSQQLANLNVALTGQTTHFVQGQSTASFGSGITVNGTTVTDATHATANITIPLNAEVGPRTVMVTTGSEVAAAINAFTVKLGPRLNFVVPDNGYQGLANLNVALLGQGTHFVQGQSTASFGSGITVNGTSVTDTAHATANITIPLNAQLGARDVTVTTGDEVAGLVNAFTVTQAGLLTLVVPNSGQPGANLRIAVKGQFTHFVPGVTTVSFGAGVTVNSTTVTDGTHATVNLTIAGGAGLGARDIVLTTGGEVATLPNGFTVTAVSQTDTQAFAYVVGRRLSPSQGGTDGTQIVSVIDTAANVVVATIPAGQGCSCVGSEGIAVSPDGALVYVTNEQENSVSVIRTASNSVIATIPVGTGPIGVGPIGTGPIGVAASPDGGRIYVLNGSGTTSVVVINTATNAIMTNIPLGVVQARGIAVAPDGKRLYVSTYGSNTIKVIDTASVSVVTTVSVGNLPMGVDVSPDGAFVYVANGTGNTVSVINTGTNTVVATIPVGNMPYSVRITPNGTRAYVVGPGLGNVAVINTQTNTVVATSPAFGYAVEFTPDGTRAHVTNGSNAQIVNTATNGVIGTISLDTGNTGLPLSIAMSPGPTRVISLSGNLVFGAVKVGATRSATLTILNTGNSPLTVNSIVFPPGFSGNWTSGIVAAGASQNVLVTFAPTSSKSYIGSVTVNANQTSGTYTIAAVGSGTSGPPLSHLHSDFDGDGKSDIAVFRPSTGQWFIKNSGSQTDLVFTWGGFGDIPVPGDYDGDGKSDIAVFRPSTTQWFIKNSGSQTDLVYAWGGFGDIPVPGDYDGDGRSDIAVYRRSTGQWFIVNSGSQTGVVYTWGGGPFDIPVPGDYDGDGRSDIAVYRRSTGQWFIVNSGSQTGVVYTWGGDDGIYADIPVPGDYDGDGKSDIAVFRPSTGQWFIINSGSQTGVVFTWGGPGDILLTGDYDGDGKSDIAVFRPPAGLWFINNSGSQTSVVYTWGGGFADIPVFKRP